jgi:hypothetical protein
MKSTTLFTAKDIQRPRKHVPFPERGPQGWGISQASPLKVLKKFMALHLKEGLTLRAYHFRQDGMVTLLFGRCPKKALFR